MQKRQPLIRQRCSGFAVQGSKLLEGKWALVTGSARGIGRAVAEAFASEAANVIITCEPEQKEDLEVVSWSMDYKILVDNSRKAFQPLSAPLK